MKLYHLSEYSSKVTGFNSITKSPTLGGEFRQGGEGQRLGEMELWGFDSNASLDLYKEYRQSDTLKDRKKFEVDFFVLGLGVDFGGKKVKEENMDKDLKELIDKYKKS